MSRTGAVFLEHEAVVAAAVIAAQATGSDGNFRQRDVRFFIELFSNWMQSTTLSWSLNVHNAQVLRHLDVAVSAGWARRVGRTPPQYRLTPEGLLELLGRLGMRKNLTRLDEFFLVFHFFDAYAARLAALVERSGPLASRSLAVSVHELLDKKALVARERAMVASAVIGVVQREFPYELNSQKPLHALFAALPEPWQRAELVDAAARRADAFWDPTRALLLAYDGILASLPVE
jgi:hypothetical protein